MLLLPGTGELQVMKEKDLQDALHRFNEGQHVQKEPVFYLFF